MQQDSSVGCDCDYHRQLPVCVEDSPSAVHVTVTVTVDVGGAVGGPGEAVSAAFGSDV